MTALTKYNHRAMSEPIKPSGAFTLGDTKSFRFVNVPISFNPVGLDQGKNDLCLGHCFYSSFLNIYFKLQILGLG